MASPDDSSSGEFHAVLASHLRRHKEGDRAATNAIISHCETRFKHLTRQMLQKFPNVQKWEETTDVYHNVVIRLTKTLGQLTFETPLDFLRLASCHNRRELIDLSKKCRPQLLGGAAGDSSALDPVANAPDPSNDPYKLALWHEVHSLIDQLPPEYRELFDLLYYQGLTQPQAAELLDIPLRTLKRRWQQAREHLIRILGNDTPF